MSIYFQTKNGMKTGPIEGDVTIAIDDSEGIIIEEVSTNEIPFDTPIGEKKCSCNTCVDNDELEFRYTVLQCLKELLQERKHKHGVHREYRKTKGLLE